jgi:hypothetical protein
VQGLRPPTSENDRCSHHSDLARPRRPEGAAAMLIDP